MQYEMEVALAWLENVPEGHGVSFGTIYGVPEVSICWPSVNPGVPVPAPAPLRQ